MVQSIHPSRVDSFGQQTRPLRHRLSHTTRHKPQGQAACEPQGDNQRAQPQPRAHQVSGKTQAPRSITSFTAPLFQGTHSTCPVRGCCSTGSTAGPVPPARVLLPIPLCQPQPTIHHCVPRTRAGQGLGEGWLPAGQLLRSVASLRRQPLSSSLLRALLQSHSQRAKEGKRRDASPISHSQTQESPEAGSSSALLAAEPKGSHQKLRVGRAKRTRCPEERVHPRLGLAARRGLALLPREPLACYYGEKTQQSTTDSVEWRRRNRHRGASLAGVAVGERSGLKQFPV